MILSQMRDQAQIAIDTADVIMFMVDVRQGLVDADAKVADMLRRSKKPIVLVVNKVDNFDKFMPDVYEFYNLGIGDPVPVSAASKLGLGELLDEVIEHFPADAGEGEEDERPRIAIVGKPNVGKSSIINRLLGENRVIVSNIAGTTRDAIDTAIKHEDREYVFIDTAGLRRKIKSKRIWNDTVSSVLLQQWKEPMWLLLLLMLQKVLQSRMPRLLVLLMKEAKVLLLLSINGMLSRKMIRQFTNTQRKSEKHLHICHMRN